MIEQMVYRAAIPVYYLRVRRFLALARRARDVQRNLLFQKLRRHASSDFGRDHDFAGIRSVADFRQRVPVTDYEYYRPYIDRVAQGDLGALFGLRTQLLMFALTSGTTGQSKFIPVTREFFDEYRQGWQIWGAANFAAHVDQVHKKTLHLASNWQQSYTSAGIPCGNISGLAAETSPRWTRRLFFTPPPLVRIPSARAKYYATLRIAIQTPALGMIITANPSTLLEFARQANADRESLIRDVFDGTLSGEVDIPPPIRAALRRRISRPDPARARELEAIIQRTGTLYPKDFWPQLSMLGVWLGGSVGVYLPRLKEFYGETAFRDHGLSASEGRMTIPLEDGTSCGVLDFVHHYFEFIPVEEGDRPAPTVLEIEDLEAGKDYFILLTTSSGLYRYNIHDVVRCVGFEGQAPKLQFLNKGAHFSNITGEKLSEFQVVSAVQGALEELQLPVNDFTVAPRMEEDRPGYVLLLEPSVRSLDLAELAHRIEARLEQLNCEYAEKRRTGRLRALSVLEIPAGTWRAFRETRTVQRANFEQYKHPCLVGDLQFADTLLTQYATAKTDAD